MNVKKTKSPPLYIVVVARARCFSNHLEYSNKEVGNNNLKGWTLPPVLQ